MKTVGGRNMTFTPQKTAEFERKIKEWYRGPKYPKDVSLCVRLMFDEDGTALIIEPVEVEEKTKLRGDIDNYIKCVLDGLNGVAWHDDRQVVKVTGTKL